MDKNIAAEYHKVQGDLLKTTPEIHHNMLRGKNTKFLHRLGRKIHPRQGIKTHRNDMCICGSGKKYKHCCLPSKKSAYVD